MKDVIYNFINEHMMIHIVLIALCIAATIGAMFVDLVSGIMKAKQRGRQDIHGYRNSHQGEEVFHSIYRVVLH